MRRSSTLVALSAVLLAILAWTVPASALPYDDTAAATQHRPVEWIVPPRLLGPDESSCIVPAAAISRPACSWREFLERKPGPPCTVPIIHLGGAPVPCAAPRHAPEGRTIPIAVQSERLE